MRYSANIFLVGPMGVGKTTIGKQLASKLGLSFEEATSGVLFDITHKSKIEEATRNNIISLGHGLDTQYLRPEE